MCLIRLMVIISIYHNEKKEWVNNMIIITNSRSYITWMIIARIMMTWIIIRFNYEEINEISRKAEKKKKKCSRWNKRVKYALKESF